MLNITNHQINANQNKEIPLTPSRMAIIKTMDMTRVGKDVEKLGPSHIFGGNRKWCSCFGKQFCSFSKCESKCEPYDQATSLLGRYTPTRSENVFSQKTCRWTLITIQNSLKRGNTKMPINWWDKQNVYIHAIDYTYMTIEYSFTLQHE